MMGLGKGDETAFNMVIFGILNVSGVEMRELLDSCLTLGGDFCMFDHENTFLILMFTQHLN